MNQKELFAAVRQLGTVTISKGAFANEYKVNLKGGNFLTAYFTDDKDDALNTARAMALNLVKVQS